MRKIIALMLVLALVLSLSGCGLDAVTGLFERTGRRLENAGESISRAVEDMTERAAERSSREPDPQEFEWDEPEDEDYLYWDEDVDLPEDPDATEEEWDALVLAVNYLRYYPYSQESLTEALSCEYSEDAVQYAVDNCGADWAEQAVRCLDYYLDYGYTRSDLREMLEYEGYADEEIEAAMTSPSIDWNEQALCSAVTCLDYGYGYSETMLSNYLLEGGYSEEEKDFALANCGADWFEESVRCAESYLELFTFDREELIDQLLFEGFTAEQAAWAADACGLD